MLRKNPLIIFTLAFAIVALFTASEVMAFCDWCDPYDFAEWVDPGESGWTVRFTGISQVTDGCTGVDPDTGALYNVSPCWRFNYEVGKQVGDALEISGMNYLAVLIPDCCTLPKVYIDNETTVTDVVSEPANWHIYGIGAGEPRDNWAENIPLGYVGKVTPDDSTAISIVATTNAVTVSAATMSVSRVKNPFVFKMVVPGCEAPPPPVPLGARTSFNCVSLTEETSGDDQGLSMSYTTDLATGCINTASIRYHPDDLAGDATFNCSTPPELGSTETGPDGWCSPVGGNANCAECVEEIPTPIAESKSRLIMPVHATLDITPVLTCGSGQTKYCTRSGGSRVCYCF